MQYCIIVYSTCATYLNAPLFPGSSAALGTCKPAALGFWGPLIGSEHKPLAGVAGAAGERMFSVRAGARDQRIRITIITLGKLDRLNFENVGATSDPHCGYPCGAWGVSSRPCGCSLRLLYCCSWWRRAAPSARQRKVLLVRFYPPPHSLCLLRY